MERCRWELLQHREIYEAFYTGEDLLEEFDHHVNSNNYNLQVVDIILQVIANCLKTTVCVVDVRGNAVVESDFPPRESPCPSQFYILRRGEHFDGLVPAASFISSDTSENESNECSGTYVILSSDSETAEVTKDTEEISHPECFVISSNSSSNSSETEPEELWEDSVPGLVKVKSGNFPYRNLFVSINKSIISLLFNLPAFSFFLNFCIHIFYIIGLTR